MRSCDKPCEPTSCPAAAICRRSAGCSFAIRLSAKNVAFAPARASRSRSFSVPTCKRRSAAALRSGAIGIPWYQSSRSMVNACFTVLGLDGFLAGESAQPDLQGEERPDLSTSVGACREVFVDERARRARIDQFVHARVLGQRLAHVVAQRPAEPRG